MGLRNLAVVLYRTILAFAVLYSTQRVLALLSGKWRNTPEPAMRRR